MAKSKSLVVKDMDSLDSMKNSELVGLSKSLLDATIRSSAILEWDKGMNEQKLKEAKVVLGFLNAINSVMKTKIQVFKLTDVDGKVNFLKNRKVK